MKYKNLKEVSHGFRKKYKISQKLVYVMVTVNISSNLRRLIWSAVINKFNTVRNMALINLGCVFRDVLLMNFFKGKKYWNIRVRG